MTYTILKTLAVPLLALALPSSFSYVAAQATATTQSAAGTVTTDRRPGAPQVVTVVHRLNGIKVLRLLRRSGEVGAVETIDEALSLTREVHTNIIAGLALDDGETIAVWLPEADVEVDAWAPFASTTGSAPSLPSIGSPPVAAAPGSIQLSGDLGVTPELMIIGRDGKRRPAQYIGLDGITGLSLLRISDKSLPTFTSTGATTVTIKQRVRLFAPEPVDERASTNSSVSVRLGETAGTIVSLKHGLDGTISRIKMNSLKLSAVECRRNRRQRRWPNYWDRGEH